MTPRSLLLLGLALPLASAGLHDDLSAQFSAPKPPRTWDEAYDLAAVALEKLNAFDKISLTTGTGVGLGPCSGNLKEIKKIGFPWLCLNDGPTALRGADLVTVFPAGITTGATWDRELMYLRGRAMGIEARIKGANVLLSPVAGALGRAPDAGRNWESFSSDPYLSGWGNAESVRGLQDEGVIATVKHWIGNEQEHYRLVLEHLVNKPIAQSLNSIIDERTLKELYEWPFADAIHAGVGAVMCAYQRVNDEYSCESSPLIKTSLKSPESSGGLGFRGFVMTDWFAVAAAHLSAPAGLDMVMPGDLGGMGALANLLPASDGALKSGSRLDEAATRILAAWYKLRQETGFPEPSFSSWFPNLEDGIFVDRAYIGQINQHVPANPPLHAELARRIAAEGTTLLKNTGALPLTSERRIAVFGSDAGPIPGGADDCGNFGACSNGTLAMGWGSGAGTFEILHDPLAALTSHAKSTGATISSVLDDYAYSKIKSVASDSQDVCLTFINSRSGEHTNTVNDHEGDRNNLSAWYDGDTLIETVASNCKNTVVVIHSVGAITMESWITHPNVTAVLLAHLPGQESGTSLVDVLYGSINPSGKLPYTIAKEEKDFCCSVQKKWTGFSPKQEFSERLLIDYKHFDANDITPRFEFGFGLSYTEFKYSGSVSVRKKGDVKTAGLWDTVLEVSTTVRNSGGVEGKEVVQLYIEFPGSAPGGTPVRQLRGFEKVELGVGESAEVRFGVRKRDVSYWSVEEKKWVVPSGEFGVVVGRSSRKFEGRTKVRLV